MIILNVRLHSRLAFSKCKNGARSNFCEYEAIAKILCILELAGIWTKNMLSCWTLNNI